MVSIVANSRILKQFEKIDIFQLDLGKNLMGGEKNTFRILDDFIQQYKDKGGRIIHKFGNIGSLNFYLDPSMDNNYFIIHRNGRTYEIDFEDTPDVKRYLSQTLLKLEQQQKEEDKVVEEMKQNSQGQYWVATDDKNYGKKYEINQKLDRETYLEEILKKKKVLK